jgi:uroporphyrinogen decarboxylase
MNHRERYLAAVSHKPTDRPPMDFIAEPRIVGRIAGHLGAADLEEVLTRLGVDFRHIYQNDFRSKPIKDASGAFVDIWGVRRRPVANEFGSYDEVDYRPFAEIQSMRQVEAYAWPSPDVFDFGPLKERCSACRDEYVVVFGDPGIMDVINGTSYARGMERVLMDIATEDPVGLALMDRYHQFYLEVAEKALVAADGMIDVLWIGDDYGTQTGPLMRMETWNRLFRRKLQSLIDLGHRFGARVMLHSCGSNRTLIPRWIEMGLDIYQTVQVEAAHMDPAALFGEFGESITFHGMIGLQSVLSRGTPEDVRSTVRRMVELSGGSGYIVAPTHFFDLDVPMRNICAIYEAAAGAAILGHAQP